MGDEIPFATIADYVERRLSPAHAAHVRELLAQPAIAERHTGSLAWLTAFRALSASVPSRSKRMASNVVGEGGAFIATKVLQHP